MDPGQQPRLFCEAHLTEEKLRLGGQGSQTLDSSTVSRDPFLSPHSPTPTLLGAGRTAISCSPRMPYRVGGGASEASSKEENRGAPDQILKDWW